ncbi:MFS transporter [Granulicella cerasi]|uniref:MFS transporter n=1 Tax=Granulicella cerasi TaxID=741063 RepID=A0ABW1ZAU3_9BACT|nr:MFS transporter [Granulicella cerasi]
MYAPEPHTLAPAPPEGRRGIALAGTLTLLFVACFTVMVGSVIAPALPSIAMHLQWPWSPGWLVTIPSLGVVIFGPLAGKLIDRHGGRSVLFIGLALYGTLGMMGAMFTASPWLLLADRLLLGGSTALAMAAGTTLIAEHFQGAERLRMIARQGMAIEFGGVLFLAAGGALGRLHWSAPFTLYVLAWPCAALVLLCLPASARHPDASVDNSASPNLRTMHTLVEATLCMAIFFVAYTALPLALASRFGDSESRIGYLMALISIVAVLVAAMLPRINQSVALGRLIPFALLLFGVGHLTLASSHRTSTVIVGLALLGIGFAFAIPVVNHEMIERSSPAQRGRNLGLLSVAIFLGQFLSSFAGLASADSFTTLRLTGLLSLACGIVWLLLRERIANPRHHTYIHRS